MDAEETPADLDDDLQRLQRPRIQPHPVQGAGAEILDQHIGPGQQAAQDHLALLAIEIQHDRALVAVEPAEKADVLE